MKPLIPLYLISSSILSFSLSGCLETRSNLATSNAPAQTETGNHATLEGEGILSINHSKTNPDGEKLAMRPGRNVVEIKRERGFEGKGPIKLTFRVKPNGNYRVNYDRFFASSASNSLGPPVSSVANNILDNTLSIPDESGILIISGIALASAVGVAELAGTIGSDMTEGARVPDYVDIMVVSDDPREGVVSRVRVHQDGTLDVRE